LAIDSSFGRRFVHVVGLCGWDYLGVVLSRTKVQLCGRLAIEVDGRRVEGDLPGRQGRLLVGYLVANRLRSLTREELLDALWPDGRDGGLAPLLSKTRRVLPLDGLAVSAEGLWVDVEAAVHALHRAESALAQDDAHGAWGPSQVALFVSGRPFMAGEEASWIDEQRRQLDAVRARSLEAYAHATLRVGGTELPAAVRAARELTRREPYRETGWRILMRALAAEGNTAEALVAYEGLRRRLRDDLGIGPSAPTQELHRALLA
jgi:SARP family transcriptional regulator, regulator of embCAB operon